jgi:hypothetical protein
MKLRTRSLVTKSLLVAVVFLLGSFRLAHAQADLIIATNAHVTFPSCTEQITYFYFFTVVDDGGGISTPVITNLSYAHTVPSQIDVYDNGEFTYATFEFAITIPAPLNNTANDCFTITYEGESVNPCVDVTKPTREICSVESDVIQACAHKETGALRIVQAEAACRPQEYRLELALPIRDTPSAASVAAPAPRER